MPKYLKSRLIKMYDNCSDVAKDYLISLSITISGVIIFVLYVLVYDFFHSTEKDSNVYSFYNISKTVEESINSCQFEKYYDVDPELSHIDSSRILPPKRIWYEKQSLGYYVYNDSGYCTHISDTIQSGYLLHLEGFSTANGGHNNSNEITTNFPGNADAIIKNYSTKETLHSSSSSTPQLNNLSDTISIIIWADELVNKGNICLVKE